MIQKVPDNKERTETGANVPPITNNLGNKVGDQAVNNAGSSWARIWPWQSPTSRRKIFGNHVPRTHPVIKPNFASYHRMATLKKEMLGCDVTSNYIPS